jgi:hypothetical protein
MPTMSPGARWTGLVSSTSARRPRSAVFEVQGQVEAARSYRILIELTDRVREANPQIREKRIGADRFGHDGAAAALPPPRMSESRATCHAA